MMVMLPGIPAPIPLPSMRAILAAGAALGIAAMLGATFMLRAQRDDARRALNAERAAHQQSIANYRAAAAMARHYAQMRADDAMRAGQRVNQEVADDYAKRIAALRARAGVVAGAAGAAGAVAGAGRVRTHAGTGGAGGGPGIADLPRIPDPAGRIDAPPGADGFSGVCAATDSTAALIASEQAVQLDALIDWVEAQQRVFNGDLGR